MEYNASATKHLFWFVEMRETARLLEKHSVGGQADDKGSSSREKICNYFLNVVIPIP